MQFKVGDMVVLKKGLKVGKKHDGITLNSGMAAEQFPLEIISVESFVDNKYYRTSGTGYIYKESMLSLYQPKEPTMPRFSFHKLDEGFAFGIWMYFNPFSMHITFARWVFNFRRVK